MTNMKSLFASKTFWVAVIQAVAGAIAIFATAYPAVGWIAIAKSLVDVYIRMQTTQAIV
jgi:hypothetical protein